jgi:hypothetical protein
MRAKLIFDLDNMDDLAAYERCNKSLDISLALWDFSNKLRSISKYGSEEENNIDGISKAFYEILEEYNINLEKLIL